MTLRNLSVTAPLTAIGHAQRCARGLVALADRGGPLGEPDYAARPEALVTSWEVSSGEARDEMDGGGEATSNRMPARVTVTLAVPAARSMEQVEAALRTLARRVGAAGGTQGAAPAWDGTWRSRPGN